MRCTNYTLRCNVARWITRHGIGKQVLYHGQHRRRGNYICNTICLHHHNRLLWKGCDICSETGDVDIEASSLQNNALHPFHGEQDVNKYAWKSNSFSACWALLIRMIHSNMSLLESCGYIYMCRHGASKQWISMVIQDDSTFFEAELSEKGSQVFKKKFKRKLLSARNAQLKYGVSRKEIKGRAFFLPRRHVGNVPL